jgi:dihydroorotate dehydrogenase
LVSQKGGLSGRPLKPLALHAVAEFYKLTNGQVPIIGCGGIQSGADALDFIESGASVIQLYTAFGYHGPGIVREIKDYLANECQRRGVHNISALVGSRHRK